MLHVRTSCPHAVRPQTKEAVGREMTGATFGISEAVWAAGDFRKKVRR
jgi:hypothetical protein